MRTGAGADERRAQIENQRAREIADLQAYGEQKPGEQAAHRRKRRRMGEGRDRDEAGEGNDAEDQKLVARRERDAESERNKPKTNHRSLHPKDAPRRDNKKLTRAPQQENGAAAFPFPAPAILGRKADPCLTGPSLRAGGAIGRLEIQAPDWVLNSFLAQCCSSAALN